MRDFGNPNAKVSFDHYSALKFFEEGNNLWVIRAIGAGAKYAAAVVVVLANGDTSIRGIPGGLVDPENPNWNDLIGAGETPIFLVYAKSGQGSYGNNFSISIESSNLEQPQSLVGTSLPTDGSLQDGSYKYVVAALSKSGESLASSPSTVALAGGNGTAMVSLSWAPVIGAFGYAVYREVLVAGSPQYYLLAKVGAAAAEYQDRGYVTPDNSKVAVISPANLSAPSDTFTLHVYDNDISYTTPQESMVVSLSDTVDETGVNTEITSKLNPFSVYLNARSNYGSLLVQPTLKSHSPVPLTGGDSGSAPTSADINRAWNTFLNKEQYEVDVLINSGRTSIVVQHHMDLIARTRGDCVAFLDVPATVQKFQDAIDFRNVDLNLNSSYSALFGPDLLISDQVTSKILYVPPSGAMAALYARTASVGAPWFSIAGLNRGLVNCLDIRYYYDEGMATALFQSQVNYVRKFLGRGIALWEQSTLSNKTSALQFLNVRQLLNIMKRSMYSYLIYSMQEPNDPILRRQVKFGLDQYLETVVQGRGIKRFNVSVGDALNTPAYVNSGVLRVAITFIPILAVREIQLSLLISKEGLELSESEVAALA